jgi:ribosome-associated toxin RatA of RatAB toxin-antitoxin module
MKTTRIMFRTFSEIRFNKKYKILDMPSPLFTEVVTNVAEYKDFIKFCSQSKIIER